jgi:folate-dependent phosphoribosylglycinamide formyltransferase PurN
LTLKKIDLFTNELEIIKILSTKFSFSKIFTEDKNLYKIQKKLKKNIFLVKFQKKMVQIKPSGCSLGISYGFGIIFTNKIIKKYKEGIWNIHSGDLPKYRGRHPITAAFLNNEKKIGLSIHSINEKIDQGYLLAKCFVKRTYQDDEFSIKKKLLKNIKKLINTARINFKNKNVSKILKGNYYKPFYNGIYIADSKKFNFIFIYNAAKAQKCFEGIRVNGKKYYDAIFYSKKKVNNSNKTIICENDKKLILVKKK